MKFVEITGAVLLKLADSEQVPELIAAGIHDHSRVRVNRQGDIEVFENGSWGVIGGLLGDFDARIQKLTGLDWS